MKKKCALYASKLVKDGMVVGLGGGSTIQYLIDYVKDKDIQVVTPSAKTALKAQKEGLTVLNTQYVDHVDIAFDGCDEVDSHLNALKSGGGIHTQEKIIASMADEYIVLVDEINRAPAKTQAALFEVMEERQVSIDGCTHKMGDLYTILATQNPVEQEGTYRLPEAQLDRFLMKVTMGYPTADEELEILKRHEHQADMVKLTDIQPVLTKKELLQLRSYMHHVVVDESLLRYITQIVQQTRTTRAVYLGASPRASVAMLQASKAYALLQGRDFVTPEDIKFVTPSILQHRLMLTAEAEMEGYTAYKVAQRLIDKVEVPK